MNMSWLLIDNAIISMVAADVLYRYANIAGSYYNGHPLETLFHGSYILFGLSFFVEAGELSLGINIFNRGSRLGWIKFEDAYKMSFKIMANVKIKYSTNKSLRLDLKKP